MPLTVITLKKVPPSLRGDLTKWMQEIATGVYVGNFNRKVREQLWERVVQSAGTGEVTLSYAHQNEIGYHFDTFNTQRKVINYDGIPLVMVLNPDEIAEKNQLKYGFSNASKFRNARKYSAKLSKKEPLKAKYVVVDIETDGLDSTTCQIIEIGAVKVNDQEITRYHSLINYNDILPQNISQLTGITQELLNKEGQPLDQVLEEFIEFIRGFKLVGYGIDFDITFLNKALKSFDRKTMNNKAYDLIRFVKKEKQFLKDYKLQSALIGYEINEKVEHRALEDAELIYQLSSKVIKFLNVVNQE